MVDFSDEAKKLEQEGEQKAEEDVKKRFGEGQSNQQDQAPQQPNQQAQQ